MNVYSYLFFLLTSGKEEGNLQKHLCYLETNSAIAHRRSIGPGSWPGRAAVHVMEAALAFGEKILNIIFPRLVFSHFSSSGFIFCVFVMKTRFPTQNYIFYQLDMPRIRKWKPF